jgi:hypothetical protein
LGGAVRYVADGEEHAFADEQSLLALLHQMSQATGESLKESDGRKKSPKGDNHI